MNEYFGTNEQIFLEVLLLTKLCPQVSCERSRHPRHSNTPGRQLRIAVTNVSRDLAASMETMVIDQVSIIYRLYYYLLFTNYYRV